MNLPTWDQKISVLHVIESLARGGAERRLVNDLTYLAEEGVENHVAFVLPAEDLRAEIESLGVPVYPLGLRGRQHLPAALLRLRRLVRRTQPHILHTQLFFADLLGRLAAKRFLSPRQTQLPRVVSTAQNTIYEPDWRPYSNSPKRLWLDRLTARRCVDHCVAVSEHAKRSTIRWIGYRPEDVTVIYNTVDPGRFVPMTQEERNTLRGELGLSPEDFVLFGAGRLVPEKGFQVMFRALAKFSSQRPGIRFILAGGGPGEGDLKALHRDLGLGDRVRFLGVRTDLHRILQAGDLFLFSSLCCEGLPVAPLEAMALGVPCLASHVEPIGEIIEEGRTGYLFAPGDAEDLGRTLTRLASQRDEQSKVARAARESILARFDARQGAKKLAACYRSLLEGRPA